MCFQMVKKRFSKQDEAKNLAMPKERCGKVYLTDTGNQQTASGMHKGYVDE